MWKYMIKQYFLLMDIENSMLNNYLVLDCNMEEYSHILSMETNSLPSMIA